MAHEVGMPVMPLTPPDSGVPLAPASGRCRAVVPAGARAGLGPDHRVVPAGGMS
ncbi:hypothetical protein PJP10_20135 [Mycobacterium kansasii]